MSRFLSGYVGIGAGSIITAAFLNIEHGIILFCLMGLGYTLGWIMAHMEPRP